LQRRRRRSPAKADDRWRSAFPRRDRTESIQKNRYTGKRPLLDVV
jgi:hypothetical protein